MQIEKRVAPETIKPRISRKVFADNSLPFVPAVSRGVEGRPIVIVEEERDTRSRHERSEDEREETWKL